MYYHDEYDSRDYYNSKFKIQIWLFLVGPRLDNTTLILYYLWEIVETLFYFLTFKIYNPYLERAFTQYSLEIIKKYQLNIISLAIYTHTYIYPIIYIPIQSKFSYIRTIRESIFHEHYRLENITTIF